MHIAKTRDGNRSRKIGKTCDGHVRDGFLTVKTCDDHHVNCHGFYRRPIINHSYEIMNYTTFMLADCQFRKQDTHLRSGCPESLDLRPKT